MIRQLFQLLLGCTHPRTTFPLTGAGRGTYIVCLDCGKEFAYNWKEMRVGSPIPDPKSPPLKKTTLPGY